MANYATFETYLHADHVLISNVCSHFDANNDCNIIVRQNKHVPLQGSYSSTFSGHTPCSTSILYYRYKQNSVLFAQLKVFTTFLKISSLYNNNNNNNNNNKCLYSS